jgi:hypothetical protein
MAFRKGTKVKLTEASGNNGEALDRVLTISAKERHNGQDFYRVKELLGALFLESSLRKVTL